MKPDEPVDVSRREFLLTGARYALVGCLLAVAGFLGGSRRGAAAPGSQQCVNRGICRGCPAFSGCGLPQALSAKRAS